MTRFGTLPALFLSPLAGVAMIGILNVCGRAVRLGCLCLAAGVLVLGLSGCASWKAHDEKFTENDLSQSVRKARPQNNDADCWGLTEKGRQIERDLNAQ